MDHPKETLSQRFARVYGSPGEAPRIAGILRAFWPLLVICFAAGYLFSELLPFKAMGTAIVGLLFVLLAIATAFLLIRGERRLNNFLKGAKGEEWVAHELSFLSAEYAVFNGLRFAGGKQDFDHIVVAPAGLFVIETKSWKGSVEFREGRLYAGGKEPSRPPIKQVKSATAELIAFLDEMGFKSLSVHSVLCFLGTQLPEDVMNVNGVVICSGNRLVEILQESLDKPMDSGVREQVVSELKKVIG